MRIFLIPGFGEDETIFDKILDYIEGDKQFLNCWLLLPPENSPGLNAQVFAETLVARFAINSDDVIIGHSMGGWIALHLKNLVNCRVIQIASWTNRKQLRTPVSNRYLIYFAARTGIYLNNFVLRWLVKSHYHNSPSKSIFGYIFKKLIEGNRNIVINQLRIIFEPHPTSIDVSPDLTIHSRADQVVRYPDSTAYEVPGDHFAIFTHPADVARPISELLKNRV